MVIRETYLRRIRPFYHSEMIKVLTGIRRCGKSTILRQIIQELSEEGISEERIIFINFEDYSYRNLLDSDTLYRYILERIGKEGKFYLFFDEIQSVDRFEVVINSFRATHDVSIFLTGSNSKLLSGELATHLGGRTLSFRIMPFSFSEFMEFRADLRNSMNPDEMLDEYLKWGGFPLVCGENDEISKEVILSNIYDSVVLKDIVIRNNVSSTAALDKILDYVIANSSLTISGNAVAASISEGPSSVSAPTVYDYLRYIEEACICDKISRYDVRGKSILAFQEKIYVCDPGFFRLKKNRIKDEYGHIIETVCYNELISRGYKVFIGKTQKGEVDFIAEQGQEKFYMQTAYLLSDERVVEREFGAYSEIRDNYPKYVVTRDRTTVSRDGIIHMKLVDFLLGKKL